MTSKKEKNTKDRIKNIREENENDDDDNGKEGKKKNETNLVHCEVGGSSPYVPALHGSVGELTLPVEYHPLATSTTDDPPTPTT